jgi:hypothetical protein
MNKKELGLVLAVLLLLLIFAYVPKMHNAGWIPDEWLRIFTIENEGPFYLVREFMIDRPLRGYMERFLITIIGTRMLHFQLIGLFLRLIDTIAFFAILMFLFPKRREENLMASALALIFPGYGQQMHSMDYMAQMVSHAAMVLSFVVCLLPIYFKKAWLHAIAIPVSLLLVITSAGIMELYIGMDLFRYFLIYLALRQYSRQPVTFGRFAAYSAPYTLGTIAFSVWRVFFFENQRASIETGPMLENLKSLQGLMQLAGALFENLYRLIISAWYQPLIAYFEYIRLDWLAAAVMMTFAGAAAQFLITRLNRQPSSPEQGSHSDPYARWMVIGGVVFAIGSLAPIVFGGREIVYSTTARDRFSFPGMMGSVMIVVGVLSLLRPQLRNGIWLVLAVSSLLVHSGIANLNEIRYQTERTTWWQFSWRVPDLEPKTVVTGRVDNVAWNESQAIWSPINLMYHPGRPYVIIGGEVLNSGTQEFVTEQILSPQRKRGYSWTNDFSQVLIFSRPEGSCLQMLDGKHPEISGKVDKIIQAVAPFSQLERIDPFAEKQPQLDPNYFGTEPGHDWCYYYQKAQLARQQRDWDLAAGLGAEALANGYTPNDPVEWIVIVQAFAYTGADEFDFALEALLQDSHARSQACLALPTYSEEIESTIYAPSHLELIASLCE